MCWMLCSFKGRNGLAEELSFTFDWNRGVQWQFAKNTRALCWEMRVMAVGVAIKNRESLPMTQRCGIGTNQNHRSEISDRDNEWASDPLGLPCQSLSSLFPGPPLLPQCDLPSFLVQGFHRSEGPLWLRFFDNWNLTREWKCREFIYITRGAYTFKKDISDCIYGEAGN